VIAVDYKWSLRGLTGDEYDDKIHEVREPSNEPSNEPLSVECLTC